MSLHMQMQMGVLISEHICYEFSIDITKFFHLFSEETVSLFGNILGKPSKIIVMYSLVQSIYENGFF